MQPLAEVAEADLHGSVLHDLQFPGRNVVSEELMRRRPLFGDAALVDAQAAPFARLERAQVVGEVSALLVGRGQRLLMEHVALPVQMEEQAARVIQFVPHLARHHDAGG